MKKALLIIIACAAIIGMKSPCGCKPNAQLKKMLFTPGSVKFPIVK